MRSAELCEISRSCQRLIFSNDVNIFERTTRASPHKFSHKTGFFLCGIAEEPF